MKDVAMKIILNKWCAQTLNSMFTINFYENGTYLNIDITLNHSFYIY